MKQISETIDGSIKNILQLKTLDNSLEYSQMYDALEDTPRDFQTKLIDALNSLGQTMGVSPTEAFNKVLCKSDDGNEEVTKKLYNWWRAFFEVLGKCEKVPTVRVSEFNQKIDDLMTEIMKAGDAEATSEEEPVMESDDEDLGYQQATKDDEDKMLADMEFAVQHIGEIANKVKAVVNFINPYCGTEVNESMMKLKFKVGDMVKVVGNGLASRGWVGKVASVDKMKPGLPYTVVFKDRDSGEYAQEELELVDRHGRFHESGSEPKFKEGDIVKMRNVSGMDFHGRDAPIGTVLEIRPPHPDVGVYEYLIMGRSGEFFAYEDELEPVEGFTEEVKKNTMKFNKIDERIGGGSDEEWISADDLIGMKVSEESSLENELKKGDDGWTEIGQPVGEATVTVDANDVWDVLELLDDDVANKNLTDLINSHVRTEAEIMDAIDSCYPDGIRKGELNAYMNDSFYEIVDELGLDVERFKETGEFVEKGKPTSVELENTDGQKPEEVKSQDKTFNQDGENKTLVTGEDKKKEMSDAEAATIMGGASETDMDAADVGVSSHEVADPYNKKPVCEMTVEQEVDDPWKLSEMLWSQGKENLQELLRSELVGEEDIMQMLEDSELHNLTSINDAFAFDFPSILDSLGLDGEAWSQNLELKRKGDDSED